ncbi:TetR/AcrR family transcriptional regulator [Paenibacillaceae bacterium]|nr:TetR/AcrR family transcriptional regulator [Paenibacillaceae bacterium]
MPRVFENIGRDKVREQLLEQGFELIKQHGLKKTSVSDIAKNSGIGTGTFYNFFSSKEEFVYQIVMYKRNIIKEHFNNLMQNGKLDKEAFRNYLLEIYLSDHNIFDYINDSEIAILNARWPEEYWKNSTNDAYTTEWILSHLEGVSPNCDWKVFANLCKSISLIRYGQTRLHQDKFQETLEVYIDAIIRYVFV